MSSIISKAMAAVALLLITSFSGFAAAGEKNLHDFTIKAIDRSDMDLSQYKGKAVLLVNTASYCGFTPQYKGLQALYEKYRDEGLVVLGVPSNDFGSQEPGSEENIKRFCKVNYKVDFPLAKKMVVNGKEGTAPVYEWLAASLGDQSRPKWNFHKYLIGPDGQALAYFPSKIEPENQQITSAVEKALADTGR